MILLRFCIEVTNKTGNYYVSLCSKSLVFSLFYSIKATGYIITFGGFMFFWIFKGLIKEATRRLSLKMIHKQHW